MSIFDTHKINYIWFLVVFLCYFFVCLFSFKPDQTIEKVIELKRIFALTPLASEKMTQTAKNKF